MLQQVMVVLGTAYRYSKDNEVLKLRSKKSTKQR
jgi:hypothetical protein